MSQQPDKLFKAKLENYQRPAPAGAWSRIESGMSKKNNAGLFWLKIAASLLLVVTTSIGIFSILKKDNSDPLLAEQKPVEEQSIQNAKKESPRDVIQKNEAEPKKDNTIREQSTLNSTNVAKVDPGVTSKTSQETPVPSNETIIANKVEEIKEEDESVPIDEKAIAGGNTVKSFKLVVEADQVNEKYLTKRTIAKATSEDNTSSGIKKLLDKANDLKNNQDPFGDLRQMKDEILALNFQSNKKHEQNK